MCMLLTESPSRAVMRSKTTARRKDFPQLRAVYGEGWESFINDSSRRVWDSAELSFSQQFSAARRG